MDAISHDFTQYYDIDAVSDAVDDDSKSKPEAINVVNDTEEVSVH